MKKLLIVCLLALSATFTALAQPHLLVIQGETGKFYVEHIVDVKENWYSVGRLYNISPKEIAPFNGSTLSKPLEIGQKLKIPLTAVNFDQKGLKSAGETLVPIYHVIEPKEWMYHISTTYNKVPVANLEKWNHISADQAKSGMELIVGYLKVKTSQSTLAAAPKDQPQAGAMATVVPKKEEPKNNAAIALVAPPKEEVKTESLAKKETLPVVQENKAAENNPSVQRGETTSNIIPPGSRAVGGYFSNEYGNVGKSINGQAGTFKSTSGWQDGKYYALMNNVPVGTIVKITTPANNKYVYAKVLGQLPDMKESAGLVIRISNAAAMEMGAGDGKFNVELKY